MFSCDGVVCSTDSTDILGLTLLGLNGLSELMSSLVFMWMGAMARRGEFIGGSPAIVAYLCFYAKPIIAFSDPFELPISEIMSN
jgi:hypothetical protein